MKVAFLDRDGTIVRDYPDEEWREIYEPEFLPGAVEALAEIQSKGFELVILTNQYTIGEGIISQQQYDEFTVSLLLTLSERGINILDVFHCPDPRDRIDNCLKPEPSMFDAAMRRYPEIDITSSFMIGDSPCDAELASKVGLAFFGIGRAGEFGYGTRVQSLQDLMDCL